MTKYDLVYEVLQEQVEIGDLTIETAEYLNDVAFEMYSDEEYIEKTALDKYYDRAVKKTSEAQKKYDLYKNYIYDKYGKYGKETPENAKKILKNHIKNVDEESPNGHLRKDPKLRKYLNDAGIRDFEMYRIYRDNATLQGKKKFEGDPWQTFDPMVDYKNKKKKLGCGRLPKDREPNTFLKMQKELDKINKKK